MILANFVWMARIAVTVVLLAVLPAASTAQQPQSQSQPASGSAERDLATQLSNPVSSLVSVPFQFNWEQNVGPFDLTRFVLNLQPVIPFSVTPDWNLIVRLIAPLVSQPPLFEDGTPTFGISDLTTSFFVSPSKSAITWGVGPVVVLPSTSEPTIGTGKWSTGPTIVALKQSGPWTIGTLWNQVWSFSGDARRSNVNQMFLQPFVAYQATHTLTLNLNSEMTANWEVDEGRWTVPITFMVGKLASFGTFPASYQIGVSGFAAHPDVGPTWRLRAAIVLLLPRRT